MLRHQSSLMDLCNDGEHGNSRENKGLFTLTRPEHSVSTQDCERILETASHQLKFTICQFTVENTTAV